MIAADKVAHAMATEGVQAQEDWVDNQYQRSNTQSE